MSTDGYEADGYARLSSRGSDESQLTDSSGDPPARNLFAQYHGSTFGDGDQDASDTSDGTHGHGDTSPTNVHVSASASNAHASAPPAEVRTHANPMTAWFLKAGTVFGKAAKSTSSLFGKPVDTGRSDSDNTPVPSATYAGIHIGATTPRSAPAMDDSSGAMSRTPISDVTQETLNQQAHITTAVGNTPVSDVTQQTLEQLQQAHNTPTRRNTAPRTPSSDSTHAQSHVGPTRSSTTVQHHMQAFHEHVPDMSNTGHTDRCSTQNFLTPQLLS